jgi:hypothetical protein
MKGQPVLFTGKTQVLEAYASNDYIPWAILVGKEIFTAFPQNDEPTAYAQLAAALDLLEKGGSQGIMTLRVYPNETEDICYSTTPVRGFNFKLYGENASPWHRDQQIINDLREQNTRLAQALEKGLEEEHEKEGAPSFIGSLSAGLGAILNHPDMQQMIIAGIAKGVGMFSQKVSSMFGKTAQVAGVQAEGGISPEQAKRVDEALDILEGVDPLLGDHLLKLAGIAKNNPGTYSMMLGMLDKM